MLHFVPFYCLNNVFIASVLEGNFTRKYNTIKCISVPLNNPSRDTMYREEFHKFLEIAAEKEIDMK